MFLKVIISIIAGSLIASAGFASVSSRSIKPTSWVPYPWAKELPFTWTSVQGVWAVGEGESSSYFYVRVIRERAGMGARYLQIVEKDGQTCATVATGFGTEQEGTRIFAEMTHTSGQRYAMMLRQFEPKSLPGQGFYMIKGKVMVLSIYNHATRKTYNYPMTKVSDRTEYRCIPKK